MQQERCLLRMHHIFMRHGGRVEKKYLLIECSLFFYSSTSCLCFLLAGRNWKKEAGSIDNRLYEICWSIKVLREEREPLLWVFHTKNNQHIKRVTSLIFNIILFKNNKAQWGLQISQPRYIWMHAKIKLSYPE